MRSFHVSRSIFLVLISLFFLSCSEEQDVDEGLALPPGQAIVVEAELDKSTMYLGEDARLKVTAVYRDDVTVEFPSELRLPDGVELVNSGGTDREEISGGIVEETRWYDLTTNIPGNYVVPGVTITYQDEDGEHDYVTGAMTLKVVRTVENVDELETIRDIKPPKPIGKNYYRLYVFVASVVCGVLIVYVIRWFLKRRRLARVIEQKPTPPNIQALEELRGIDELKLLKEGREEEFIVEVSGVVRRYVERRFSVPTEKMTTDELLKRSEKGYYLGNECSVLIKEFLERCDAVKFAAHSPTGEECEAILDAAVDFIEKSY